MTVLVASGIFGLPPPTEKRATTREGFSNAADLLRALPSAVGVKVPITHCPLAPLGLAIWLPAKLRIVLTISSVSALCA